MLKLKLILYSFLLLPCLQDFSRSSITGKPCLFCGLTNSHPVGELGMDSMISELPAAARNWQIHATAATSNPCISVLRGMIATHSVKILDHIWSYLIHIWGAFPVIKTKLSGSVPGIPVVPSAHCPQLPVHLDLKCTWSRLRKRVLLWQPKSRKHKSQSLLQWFVALTGTQTYWFRHNIGNRLCLWSRSRWACCFWS